MVKYCHVRIELTLQADKCSSKHYLHVTHIYQICKTEKDDILHVLFLHKPLFITAILGWSKTTMELEYYGGMVLVDGKKIGEVFGFLVG